MQEGAALLGGLPAQRGDGAVKGRQVAVMPAQQGFYDKFVATGDVTQLAKNLEGKLVEREIYGRQVPPTAGTDGEWVTIVDELNPQHPAYPVQYLKVDLYAYLQPGLVAFDDVVLKAVGEQTRVAKDKAIKAPATRPKDAK